MARAKREIEIDLERHGGVYPYAGGRLTAEEVLRRAGLNRALLQKPRHTDLSHLASKAGSADTELLVETRQPRSADQRGDPWQLWHDWRDGADQRDVMELFGRQQGLRASLQHKDVPHGRYLRIEFENGARATIVLDQGFGAWTPPRHLRVRHDFEADAAAQARQLAAINAVLQRKGSGATYVVAMVGG